MSPKIGRDGGWERKWGQKWSSTSGQHHPTTQHPTLGFQHRLVQSMSPVSRILQHSQECSLFYFLSLGMYELTILISLTAQGCPVSLLGLSLEVSTTSPQQPSSTSLKLDKARSQLLSRVPPNFVSQNYGYTHPLQNYAK